MAFIIHIDRAICSVTPPPSKVIKYTEEGVSNAPSLKEGAFLCLTL